MSAPAVARRADVLIGWRRVRRCLPVRWRVPARRLRRGAGVASRSAQSDEAVCGIFELARVRAREEWARDGYSLGLFVGSNAAANDRGTMIARIAFDEDLRLDAFTWTAAPRPRAT